MFIEYKLKAKAAMSKKMPAVFIVSAIYLLIPIIFDMCFSFSINWGVPNVNIMGLNTMTHYINSLSSAQVTYLSVVSIVLGFMYALLNYGYSFYCLKASRGHDTSYNDLFDGFYHPGRIVLANIIISLRVMLWSLLFVIPGIIAGISYSQTNKILADDPSLTANQAVNLSKKMMYGHKLEWFMIQLSFFGWLLLSSITWNITGVYSVPYMEITNSIYYDRISDAYTTGSTLSDGFDMFGGNGGQGGDSDTF